MEVSHSDIQTIMIVLIVLYVIYDYFYKSDKPKRKRKPISQSVKDKVWRRDGGKCVECGSNERIEFDHIIPFSKGGTDTYRNLQILCERCNRSKSNNIG